MTPRTETMNSVYRWIHHHLLKILLVAYGVAAVFPGPGNWIRSTGATVVGKGSAFEFQFSLIQLLLAFLLFNAGTACRLQDFKKMIAQPYTLVLGVLFNFLAPLAFISVFAVLGRHFWHNADEIQNVLTGLAIIASMPIAGSSTAWAQGVGGNPSLILGLVMVTTILSPLSTPWVFKAVTPFLTGDYAEDIAEMAAAGSVQMFLLLSVVIPSVLGMAFRHFSGEDRFGRCQPGLKLAGVLVLLTLNYSNAAAALPQAFTNPDWDFLALILTATFVLCIIGFLAGWFLPVLTRANETDRKALMFGLGMNNNGTGLVLASASLPDHPMIGLPIIFYNLGQQVVAGIFTAWVERKKR